MDLVTARIQRDLKEFYDEKLPLIYCEPQPDYIMLVHALIEGPEDTPYSGGFFYFTVTFPNDYPNNPPRILLQTTESGKIRFNLNTSEHDGPCWTPALGLWSVLLSIQSLMNQEPLYNDPTKVKPLDEWVLGRISAEGKQYNEYVKYNTLRVAVIGMLEDGPDTHGMPQTLKDVMVQRFKANFKKYVSYVNELDATKYKWLKVSLMKLKAKFGDVDEAVEKVKKQGAFSEAAGSSFVEPPTFEPGDINAVIEEINLFLPEDDETVDNDDS